MKNDGIQYILRSLSLFTWLLHHEQKGQLTHILMLPLLQRRQHIFWSSYMWMWLIFTNEKGNWHILRMLYMWTFHVTLYISLPSTTRRAFDNTQKIVHVKVLHDSSHDAYIKNIKGTHHKLRSMSTWQQIQVTSYT